MSKLLTASAERAGRRHSILILGGTRFKRPALLYPVGGEDQCNYSARIPKWSNTQGPLASGRECGGVQNGGIAQRKSDSCGNYRARLGNITTGLDNIPKHTKPIITEGINYIACLGRTGYTTDGREAANAIEVLLFTVWSVTVFKQYGRLVLTDGLDMPQESLLNRLILGVCMVEADFSNDEFKGIREREGCLRFG